MNLRRIEEELLVIRCQEGDEAAIAELVARWHPRLVRYAWRLTGNESTARDVVQESWIAVVRGIARLDDPACFPAWIYRVLHRRATDWIRGEQRRRKLHGELENAELIRADEARNAPASGSSAGRDLRGAIDRLPADDKAVLTLKYLEEFSIAEIADALGLPEGTVKSRLHYAREKLAKAWKGKRK